MEISTFRLSQMLTAVAASALARLAGTSWLDTEQKRGGEEEGKGEWK